MPKIVGETTEGDPIFEIRSVRLVLRADANHFSRVAACSKCGREVPGAAVLSPADLDLRPHPVFCSECVSAAGPRLLPNEARRPRNPTLGPPRAKSGNGSAPRNPVLPQPDDARMAALERGLAELSGRLAAERSNAAAAIAPATEQIGKRLAALERRLDEAVEHLKAREASQRSELSTRVDDLQKAIESDANAAGVQDLEERLSRVQTDVEAGSGLAQRLEQLAGSIVAQRAELEATLNTRVDQVQTALQAAAEHTSADLLSARDEMGRTQDELRRGLAGLTARVEQLQRDYDAEPAMAQPDSTTLALQGELARAEAQLNERVDRLADGVLTHRSDILATLDARVGEVETALGRSAQALTGKEELRRARDELRREIAGLTERVQGLGAGLDAELGRVESNLVKVDARLSQRLLALAERVVAQRSELEAMLVARVEEVQAELDVLAREVATQSAAHERAEGELARLGERLTERLDRPSERADTADSVAQALEAQRADLQRQLDDGLAEVRAAVDAPVGAHADQLQAIGDRTAQMTARMSEINELLEVLDAGFGELRSGLQDVRDVVPAKGVTRASQSAALAPLRADIAAVREDLAAHEDALAKLNRSVETLKRKVRAAAPAPIPTPRKKKA